MLYTCRDLVREKILCEGKIIIGHFQTESGPVYCIAYDHGKDKECLECAFTTKNDHDYIVSLGDKILSLSVVEDWYEEWINGHLILCNEFFDRPGELVQCFSDEQVKGLA